jgi:Peptidase family M48
MINKYLLAILLVGKCVQCMAQFSALDNRLVSSGEMPGDFKKVYSEKYYETLKDDEVQDLKKKSIGREFAALTNYSIDHLLKSGRVIYNDYITTYCNDIIRHLLSKQKENGYDIRMYTLKSNDVNAYSTHQGIIIVTTGLIARLENESQLAFVLAHEIAHILNNHNVESYSYNSDLFRKDVNNRKNDLEEKILKSSKHSKESEFEADNDGWDMYIKAGYSPSAVVPTFDILLYSYLPISQKSFPFEEVEYDGFEIKKKGKNFELDSIIAEEDVDDSQSSHPNIRKRKDNILGKIGKLSIQENDFAIRKESDFLKISALAYQESVRQHIIQNQYIEALILIDAVPDDLKDMTLFLNKAKAMCYYGIQLFINNDQRSDIVRGENHQGAQGSYYHLFRKLKKYEINMLCFRQLWKLKQEQPKSQEVNRLLNQGMLAMQQKNNFEWEYFEFSSLDSAVLKKRNKKCFSCHLAFSGLTNQDEIKTLFHRIESEQESPLPDKIEQTSKLIMFSPRYVAMDMRTTIDKQFMRTELKQQYLEDQIVNYAQKLDVEVNVVDSWKDGSMTTEEFNEYSLYMEWMIERSGFSGSYFKGFLTEDIGKMTEKFGSGYIGFSMYWNMLERKKFNIWYFLGSAVTVYLFPLYLKWQFTPYHYTGYTFIMINSENGYASFVDAKEFDVKYRNYLIKAHIFNSLNQIAQ